MFVVKERNFGLGGETWDTEVARFDTEAKAYAFADADLTRWLLVDEED